MERHMSNQNNENGSEQQHSRPFNPNEHIIQIRNRNGYADYLPVQWRLVWFRDQCPEGTIETELIHLDLDRETEEEMDVWDEEQNQSAKVVKRAKGLVIFRAIVKDGKGGVATGTKSEKAASFPDYIEKAETGAIGRALAALGYGTQFTGDELNEEHRIVDSPVARSVPRSTSKGQRSINSRLAERNTASYRTAPAQVDPEAPATERQLTSIRKLYERLGRPEPEDVVSMNYLSAKELISQLSQEYNEQRQSHGKAS